MTEEKDGISRLVLAMTDEELKELDELALTSYFCGRYPPPPVYGNVQVRL